MQFVLFLLFKCPKFEQENTYKKSIFLNITRLFGSAKCLSEFDFYKVGADYLSVGLE